MRIQIRTAKRWEFLQNAEEVMQKLSTTKGCLGYHLYQDYADENHFCFVQEWESRQILEKYLQSTNFGVLLGSAKVLSEPVEIKIDITQGNMETVNAIREKGGN